MISPKYVFLLDLVIRTIKTSISCENRDGMTRSLNEKDVITSRRENRATYEWEREKNTISAHHFRDL